MKKTFYRLFTALFLAICLLPTAGLLITGPSPTVGNESPAPAPALTRPDGSLNPQFLSDAAGWFSQRFAFRPALITADSTLKATLFHTSGQPAVALGQEGWLYYAETLDGFTGAATLSPRQSYCIAASLSQAQAYAESQGAAFLFTIAPNKASLYPQFLPPALQAQAAPQAYTAPVAEALAGQGVAYADLFAPFRAQEEILYFATDSHWTNKGAALAHDVLLQALGLPGAAFEKAGGYQPTHRGDLHEMLYPASGLLEQEFTFTQPLSFRYARPIRDVDDLRIETTGPASTAPLLMFRDSFGNALHSLMAESFSAALFSRAMPYNMLLISQSDARYVVVEIVERNLPLLAQAPFLLPAPTATLPGPAAACPAPATLTAEPAANLPGYSRVTGAVPTPCDSDSPVYLALPTGQVYQAQPTDTGAPAPTVAFTAYLPEGVDAAGLQIVFRQAGQWLAASP